MNLIETLQAGGAFASAEPQKHTLKLGKNKTAEVLLRELPDAEFRKKVAPPYNRSNLIAACVCDEEGASILSVEQAASLKVKVAVALEKLCWEANGSGDQAEADEQAGKS